MGARYVAFDIEISREIATGTEDWKALRPLGISCAATLTESGELRLWHGRQGADGRYAAQLAPVDVVRLVCHLAEHSLSGRPALTWNGLGFDLDILAEECADELGALACQDLALDHTDMAFQMLCEKGFMCGLDAAAKGMGLAGKTEGMHGDLAPVMWAQGRAEQEKVLEYVAQDVRTTAQVYEAILERHCLTWLSRSGRRQHHDLRLTDGTPHRMLTVAECLALPEPDTSWLTNPWPRTKFRGWLGKDMER